MKILFDIGNTRIKAAIWRGGALQSLASCATEQTNFPEQWHLAGEPESIHIASVANSERSGALQAWADKHWGITPVIATVQQGTGGVHTAYLAPSTLGIDRWLAALGAFHLANRQPVCVIDAGTALTVDIVDHNGCHLGGMIAPGLSLMIESLTHRTAQLALEKISVPDIFAVTTESAISLGCADYIGGMIEKLQKRLVGAGLSDAVWYVTGGQGEVVMEIAAKDMEWVPDLVLQGLAIAAEATP